MGIEHRGLGAAYSVNDGNLLSYKLYTNEVREEKGKIFCRDTVYNIIFLVVLYVFRSDITYGKSYIKTGGEKKMYGCPGCEPD